MRWSGPRGIVGRVWPRHEQRGRPLNSGVRHQRKAPMETSPSPDQVFASFAEGGGFIFIDTATTENILIEGSATALEFLGKLLQAQAAFPKDCGFQISPVGAGNALFSQSSTLGIYIHRLPCKQRGHLEAIDA